MLCTRSQPERPLVEHGSALVDRQDSTVYVCQGVIVRPLGDRDAEVAGLDTALEEGVAATCNPPAPSQLGDHQSCRLRDAVWLGFRSSAVVVEAREVPGPGERHRAASRADRSKTKDQKRGRVFSE